MKASQKDLLEHSEQKVKLLQEYLSAYFSVIARDGHTEEIQITDVFCGEGMFPNGKVGSPLVFGRMAAALLAQNPTAPHIKFRFNDAEVVEGVVQGAPKPRRHSQWKRAEEKIIPLVQIMRAGMETRHLRPCSTPPSIR